MFENYDKKKIAMVLGISFLIIFALFFMFLGTDEDQNVPVVATKYAVQLPDKRFQVPVETVTDDKGYTDKTGDIQYMEGTSWTSFHLSGIYNGERFSKAYYTYDDNGDLEVLMTIDNDLDPNDGVIQGYIVENFENKTPYAYIYLDDDWKKQIGETNIIWGKDLNITKKFEWIEVADGIYMNRIEDDKERFDVLDINNRESGIFVGDFTIEDTKKTSNDKWTAIKFE